MREAMVVEIAVEMGTMKTVFEKLGIEPDKFDFCLLPDVSKQLPAEMISEARLWCRGVFSDEFSKYMAVKKLLTDELWARYEKWGEFEEHREVVLLKAAAKILKTKLTSPHRPAFFKKGKFNVAYNASQATIDCEDEGRESAARKSRAARKRRGAALEHADGEQQDNGSASADV